MAKKLELEITIDPTGAVSVDVGGAVGKQCVDLTKPFEELLGTVEERTLKPEYHRTQGVVNTRKTR